MMQLMSSNSTVSLTHLLFLTSPTLSDHSKQTVAHSVSLTHAFAVGLNEPPTASGSALERRKWSLKFCRRSSSITGSLRPNNGGMEITVDTAQLTAIITIIRDADLQPRNEALWTCFLGNNYKKGPHSKSGRVTAAILAPVGRNDLLLFVAEILTRRRS